jgi:hypothetical protein
MLDGFLIDEPRTIARHKSPTTSGRAFLYAEDTGLRNEAWGVSWEANEAGDGVSEGGADMAERPSRIRRICSHLALPCVIVLGMLLAAPGVAGYPAIDGPQLLVNALVVPPGTPVTVTLNGFPATQPVVLHVRLSSLSDQGGTPLAFPGVTDTLGSGSVAIPTTGFVPGNYIVSVTAGGSSGDLDGVLTAFAIVDAGFTGPRVVRAEPLPLDDQG